MNAARLAVDSIEKFGEYTAVHFEGRSLSNIEQDTYAKKLAAVLLDHRVGPGDRVLVQMSNCPEVLAAFQAIWKIGAVIVPVTPQLGVREVRFLVENSETKIVITLPIFAQRLGEATQGIPTCEHLFIIGETDGPGAEDVRPLLESATPYETLHNRDDDDMALLLYTSGTTGRPKGVMLTHENLVSNHQAVADLDRFEERSNTLLALPLSHSFGVLMMNLISISGATASIHKKFVPRELVEAIETFKITRFGVVPTMLTGFINFADRDRYDLSSLETINSGGAILPKEVRVEFERLYDCRVIEGYGLSECAPTATSYHNDDTYRPGSVGKAIPGVKVTIQNAEGHTLPPGEQGEICIQGPNVMKGYWKDEEATRIALDGGWLRSGDVGYLNEDGYLYITDRIKDLIIKGGENISPREIEEAIHEHPAVAEAAVIGVPDPKYGENIWAVVATKPGADTTERELLEHTAKFVTKFKIPARVIFRDELPKNPTGKISKKDLRDEMKLLIETPAEASAS